GEEGAAVRGEATVVAETVREIDRQAAGQEDGDARLHAGDRGRDRVGGGDRLRARGVQGDAKGVDPVVGGRERVVVAGQSDPVVVGKSRQRVGGGEVDGAAVAADGAAKLVHGRNGKRPLRSYRDGERETAHQQRGGGLRHRLLEGAGPVEDVLKGALA